jgi:ubiquinone/menaquinone biosynthesis C-methylase UbiE
MKSVADDQNERSVAEAFNAQSAIFDEIYCQDTIVTYKRNRVRSQLMHWVKPGSHILELNAGTGEDAVFFGSRGYTVHATDLSLGMQAKLEEKVIQRGLGEMVSNERCSFTALDKLVNKGPYDCIFSNFAGLNCTGDLSRVLLSFDRLLKPRGIVLLVVLPKFCLWETLLIFRGKVKTATRRFFSSRGRKAKIDGTEFRCWYYSPVYIKKKLKGKFQTLGVEGLCTIVPPSYIQGFAENHPGVYIYLKETEERLKGRWPWKYIGDYYIITLQKTS